MKTIKSLVPALAIGSALLLAACGGGGSSSSGATAAAPSDSSGSSTTAQGQGGGGSNLQDPAVQQCLAEKGVTLPSLPAGGRRGQRNGGAPPGTSAPSDSSAPADTTASTDAGQNGGNGQNGNGGPFAQMDPATRQALQDCGVTFGRGGQGGGGGGFGGAVNDPAVQQCLADKGITLPQRSAEQSSESPRTTSDAATRQAIQDCRAQAGSTTTTG